MAPESLGLALERPGLAPVRPGLAPERPWLAPERPGLALESPGLHQEWMDVQIPPIFYMNLSPSIPIGAASLLTKQPPFRNTKTGHTGISWDCHLLSSRNGHDK